MKYILTTFIFSLNILTANITFAQDSLIDIALEAKESIVTVFAIQEAVVKTPKASVAMDKKTGHILFARKIKAAQYEKNGAGVIINTVGLIITNFHVVSGAQRIAIKLHNGSTVPGKLVSIAPNQDLALIKIDPPFKLKPIQLANSNNISLGQKIVHIGNSEMLKETISGGKIIGLATRFLSNRKNKNVELIELNINIYKGDSGGPILNKNGELIGMVSSKLKNKQRAAFAIPSNKIKKLYLKAIK